jgi:REP element-mobilizing transposase RayT
MARKPRVEFDGAFCHVIVRGNQRQRTFHDDRDCQRYGFRLYAYVLMANHVHLLIETKRVGLSKIMQGIQGSIPKATTAATKRSAICFKAATKRFSATVMPTCSNWCATSILTLPG